MAAAMPLTITEEWVREKAEIQHDKLEDVRSLSLPGSYQEKITHLGSALKKFTRLKNLDLSRNALQSLEGLENCKHLETLNLYYNNIATLDDLRRLTRNTSLKDIDLRLNPVTRNEPDYRLYLIHALPQLEKLDDRAVRQSERDTATSYYGVDQDEASDDVPAPHAAGTAVRGRSSTTRTVPSRFAVSTLDDDDRAVLDLFAKGQESKTGGGSSGRTAGAEDYSQEDVRRMEAEESLQHSKAPPGGGGSGAAASSRRAPLRQDNTAPRLAPDGGSASLNDNSEAALAGVGLYHKEADAYAAYQGQGVFTANPEFESPSSGAPTRRSGEVRGTGGSTGGGGGDGQAASSGALPAPLEALLDLVDKYWNGTKSLHTHQRFLKLALAALGQQRSSAQQDASDKLSVLHDEIRRLKEENELLSNVAKQARNPKRSKENAASAGAAASVTPSATAAAELHEALDNANAEVETLKKKLQDSHEEYKRLREHASPASDAYFPQPVPASTAARAESNLRKEVEELRRENHHAQIRLKQYAQMQELATMLQESHKSLVHTNDHLLKEIEEMRRRHQPLEAEEVIAPGKRGYVHYSTSVNGN